MHLIPDGHDEIPTFVLYHPLLIIITIAEGRPLWFKSVPDQYQAGKTVHEYQGGYWEAKESQQWDKCPDIF